MPVHSENGEKCDGCKVLASIHTIPEQFENGRNLDGKTSLQDFDAKEVYIHPKNRSVSFQDPPKCSVFTIFKRLHDAVSKTCRLECRFQNPPFSKSAGKKCAIFVRTGGLSVEFFTVFKMCRHRVNAV